MTERSRFAAGLAKMPLTHIDRAVALLWYYRESLEYEERTASELANDLHDEGFPKQNISRLDQSLARSRYSIRGRRRGTYQIDVRRIEDLRAKYGDLMGIKSVVVGDSILPNASVSGTRVYLERLVHQINGTYENGFYDACAALCRRLMETLLIEIYITAGKHQEIQQNGVFVGLEKIIHYVHQDTSLILGRNSTKTMLEVKQLGDTAAHDRVYITSKQDIDDVRAKYRRLIQELLTLARIQP